MYTWEKKTKADGWFLLKYESYENIYYGLEFNDKACEHITIYLQGNYKHIHKADINILKFKHLSIYNREDASITNYIQKAFTYSS